jgi:hypothetical protein
LLLGKIERGVELMVRRRSMVFVKALRRTGRAGIRGSCEGNCRKTDP